MRADSAGDSGGPTFQHSVVPASIASSQRRAHGWRGKNKANDAKPSQIAGRPIAGGVQLAVAVEPLAMLGAGYALGAEGGL